MLGVRVDALQIPDVIVQMRNWIARPDRCRYIAVTGMHGMVEAQHDAQFKNVLADADLVVPDGMPLVWFARFRGHALRRHGLLQGRDAECHLCLWQERGRVREHPG